MDGPRARFLFPEQKIGTAIAKVFCVIATSSAEKASLMALRPRISWRFALFVVAVAVQVFGNTNAHATVMRFQTTSGNIDVRMFDSATPLHVANALAYVNSNRWDNTFIHRSAKTQSNMPFVIQGGGYQIDTSLLDTPIESGWHRIQNFGTVTNEPGISNLRGTMALAKTSLGPSTGTSEWFINLTNNSFLDLPANNSFTAFGRIVGNGLAVADAIAGLTRVNASAGNFNTAFSEVPIYDLAKVQSQQDVLNDDVVRMTDVRVLNIPDGDYNFDGKVDGADLAVWKADFGSTTKAEADGNGNGRVDGADYLVWQRTFGQNVGAPAAAVIAAVPEPAAATLIFLAIVALGSFRSRC
jgi:peptidyl-prolyl cis-trans isomerase A (cyclophilin A)